jgi:tRNA(Ile)-lysidine synthase
VESIERALQAWIPSGETVLVACSGGADSVALAHAARCAVGHVDHGLRRESRTEAAQVQALAGQLGVPFFLERIEGLRVQGPGLEAAAREARYAALARLAAKAGATLVATAHTRRDQAETLLLRLARGAGPGALAGIRRRRPLAPGIDLLRPLLDVSRDETEAYCRKRRLGFVEDPHNSDPARARARLRAAWPALLKLNPRLEAALCGVAELLAEEDELLESLSAELRPGMPAALQRRFLLREATAAGLRPERQHLDALVALAAKGEGQLDVPGGRVTFRGGQPQFGEQALEVAVGRPGRYLWRGRELIVGEGNFTVNPDKAQFPWALRAHRPGDRLGAKKVSDLWTHIPRPLRPRLAVLEDAAGRVFWVEGLGKGEPGSLRFEMRPEMDGLAAALTSRRRPHSASATMKATQDEETR